jgi:uncharacterized RDD family membrane protein YckC
MTEQPPPPAPGFEPAPAPQTGERPGELLDRFLARLIDFVLLAVVEGILVTAIVVSVVMGDSGNMYTASTWGASAVSAVLTTAISLGYFGYLESSRGQTVGKMVMKLRTVGPTGGHPTMEQALRRNIWVGASIVGIIPVLGYLSGLVELVAMIMIAVGINKDTVNRQAWHDHFAGGTRVVKIG